MKSIITSVLIILLVTGTTAQPNGNGGNGNNGNGNGNGGNGNNGNGKGGCGNPPCGGPNSVPIDTEWLLLTGLIAGCYIKFKRKRSTTP